MYTCSTTIAGTYICIQCTCTCTMYTLYTVTHLIRHKCTQNLYYYIMYKNMYSDVLLLMYLNIYLHTQ